VYDLEYADDMVLLAEGEEQMRSMIERQERYLDKKRSELNAEKTKIMRFKGGKIGWGKETGGGREKKWSR